MIPRNFPNGLVGELVTHYFVPLKCKELGTMTELISTQDDEHYQFSNWPSLILSKVHLSLSSTGLEEIVMIPFVHSSAFPR